MPASAKEITLAQAETIVGCARCRGWLRKTSALAIAREGATISFRGGAIDLLTQHFGRAEAAHDRTCPDCLRLVWLAVDVGGKVTGAGDVEVTPGALGPFAEGCGTCAPIVADVVRGPRSWHGDKLSVPRPTWTSIAARYRVAKQGGSARCGECGRDAAVHRYGELPVWLGTHAVPSAARSRLPTLDCARCQAFVASDDFPEVRGPVIWMPCGDPEPIYGPPISRGMGRHSWTTWKCPDCARLVAVEEEYNGWHTEVAIARPPKG